MINRSLMRRAPALLLASTLFALPTLADEISPLLDSARKAIAAQDYAGARMDLQDAMSKLDQHQIKALAATFPSPPAGWVAASPPEGSSGGGITGINMTQELTQGDARLNANLMLDNPMVGMMAGIFNNPMMASQPGTERVRIGRENAILTWREAEHAGDISLLLNGRVLLKIDGNGLANKQVFIDMAQGWKLEEIKKIAGL